MQNKKLYPDNFSAELEIYNIPPPVVNRHVGETFQTTCRARGVPTPTIIWRKDFGDVSAKCRTSNENGIGTLICENIQVEDQGVYSCSAHNSRGFVFSNHNTHLFIKPDKVCPAGYFNSDARTETECIKCFCFGQSSHCQSADLFRFSVRISIITFSHITFRQYQKRIRGGRTKYFKF